VERSGAGQRRSRRRRAARISASADSFDGDASVDEFGGVGVAELVDVDLNAGGFAVVLPAMVGGVVGERAAVPVDAGAERRAVPVAGAGEVEVEEGDVAAVVEEDGADGAALAVDADVLVVLPEVEVLDVEAADFGGAGPTHVGRLEQDRSRRTSSSTSLRGRLLQIEFSTLATSSALAGRGRVLGTLMVSILSMGLVPSRSWRTAICRRRRRRRACACGSPETARRCRRGTRGSGRRSGGPGHRRSGR
jgi:hypothetical protein